MDGKGLILCIFKIGLWLYSSVPRWFPHSNSVRKLKKDQLSTCFPTSSTLLFTTHFVTIWVNLFVVFGFVDFLLFFLKVGPCHGQWVVKITMSWWTWFPGMSELWILANQIQGRVTADQLQAGKLASRYALLSSLVKPDIHEKCMASSGDLILWMGYTDARDEGLWVDADPPYLPMPFEGKIWWKFKLIEWKAVSL